MQDPVILSLGSWRSFDGTFDESPGCAVRGFVPLTRVPGGSSAPDGCYGGGGSRVSFFASNETWFWDTMGSGFKPEVACSQWQAENPQCFDSGAFV